MSVSDAERAALVNVEILYFDGCPSFEALLPRVREIVTENGGDPDDDITLRAIETVDAAEAARFLGSPSVRVDGRDVDPTAGQRDDFGLKCRIYRFEEGQSPTPPDRWIRAAMSASSGSAKP